MKQMPAARRFLSAGLGLIVALLWASLLLGVAAPAYADDGGDTRFATSARDSAGPSRADSRVGAVDRSGADRFRPGERRGPGRWKARTVRPGAHWDRVPTAASVPDLTGQNRSGTSPSAATPTPAPPDEVEAAPLESATPSVRGWVTRLGQHGRTLLTDGIERATAATAAKLPSDDRSAPGAAAAEDTDDISQPVADVPPSDVDPVSLSEPVQMDSDPEASPARVAGVLNRFQPGSSPVLAATIDRPAAESAPQSFIRPAAATVRTSMNAPTPAPLLNLIGSAVFNVVGAALQVLSGPPALPANSTVTVRTSTLTMPGTGQDVRADWYFPENTDESTRLIYFQHGFMATGPMYSYTAAHLAQSTNSIVVVPSLSSNLFDPKAQWLGGAPLQQSVADLFAGSREELAASASAAAGVPVVLPDRFVLVGHSLGGMLVTGAAGRMVHNGAVDDLAGVVLLDAVDTNRVLPEALTELGDDIPVLNISSERYVWNLHGVVGDALNEARPGQFTGVMLVGGRHIDGLQGGNLLLQYAEYLIAGFSQPQNIEAVRILSADWINDMFAGEVPAPTTTTIEVPTSAGTATAVVLPFRTPDSVRATPWDGLADVILDVLFRFAVYEPMTAAPTTTAQLISV